MPGVARSRGSMHGIMRPVVSGARARTRTRQSWHRDSRARAATGEDEGGGPAAPGGALYVGATACAMCMRVCVTGTALLRTADGHKVHAHVKEGLDGGLVALAWQLLPRRDPRVLQPTPPRCTGVLVCEKGAFGVLRTAAQHVRGRGRGGPCAASQGRARCHAARALAS